jgi:hypothetical protein
VTPTWARGDGWARTAFAGTVVVNLVALYWPRPLSDGGIPNSDKVAHVAIFAVVAATGVAARVPLRWLVGLLVAHAFLSELIQHWLLAHRSGDPADVAADLVGVALGVLVGLKLLGATAVASTSTGGSLPS